MPSPPPLAYNAYYHIYNRGNNRENIFKEERNYRYFLKLYAKHIHPIADTFAYCLLPNHFHLLARIKEAEEQDLTGFKNLSGLLPEPRNPSRQFANLFNAYTKAINNAYPRTGALFERPFGRKLVISDAYFTQLIIYIHQNPQRHGLIDDFRDWPYSSWRTLFSAQATRLKRDTVIDWFGGIQNIDAQHRQVINLAKIEPLIGEDFD